MRRTVKGVAVGYNFFFLAHTQRFKTRLQLSIRKESKRIVTVNGVQPVKVYCAGNMTFTQTTSFFAIVFGCGTGIEQDMIFAVQNG